MIFSFTLEQVLSGQKTQTRRLMQPDDMIQDFNTPYFVSNPRGLHGDIFTVRRGKNRLLWVVGRTYAVQPARGAKSVARIEILSIRRSCAAAIEEQDARAEGFSGRDEFLATWQTISKKHTLYADVWVLTFKVVQS